MEYHCVAVSFKIRYTLVLLVLKSLKISDMQTSLTRTCGMEVGLVKPFQMMPIVLCLGLQSDFLESLGSFIQALYKLGSGPTTTKLEFVSNKAIDFYVN